MSLWIGVMLVLFAAAVACVFSGVLDSVSGC
jgi:hypothetical protein